MTEHVTLHYLRPPDRVEVFVQELLYADDKVSVTYLPATPMKEPLVIDGAVALEPGSPAIWFTFPHLMHDVGRFHTANGEFTGWYANILEPVTFVSRTEWRATDLFLDVWLALDGRAQILDEHELAEAVTNGWIDTPTAERARFEAERLLYDVEDGTWPPPIVNEWTLERVKNATTKG